jgi:hypothetical protein
VDEGGGAAKLTDFGGASLVGEDALTRPGDVLGTLAYMAPEQAEGGNVGEEADLYSLALVLYEALSGVNPVRGATPAATARRIGRPFESLTRRRGDLPRALTQAIDTALSPSPSDRGTVDRLRLVLAETLERGLSRPRRGRLVPRRAQQWSPDVPIEPTRRAPAMAPPVRSEGDYLPRLLESPPRHASAPAIPEEQPDSTPTRIALPRTVWIACAPALAAWQAFAGRSGVALLILAGLLPLLVLPGERRSSRVSVTWIAGALAPLLGLVGLAGAFPASAGQATRWRWRLALGALGYWWLTLAEPLLARRLWLGAAPRTPAHGAWEGSIATTASHVLDPMLSLGVLFGALLWACGALALPWIVRGRSATLDTVAVVVWSAAIAAAAPALDAGLSTQLTHPSPRGAVLGALVGGLVALAARALRGPV